MKTVFDHIERVKGQPHAVRHRFALGAAMGISVLIALAWLAGSLATGAFAIQGANFAEATAPRALIATTSARGGTEGLAGAAGALEAASAPAHIEIVDTAPAAPAKKPAPTIIPF